MSSVLVDSSTEELREQIRELERELSLLDSQLDAPEEDVSPVIESKPAKSDAGPEKIESEKLVKAPVASEAVVRQAVARSEVKGEAKVPVARIELENREDPQIPFKKVSFRDVDESDEGRTETKALRFLGAGVVAASVFGLWMIVVRPILSPAEPDRVQEMAKQEAEEVAAGYEELKADLNAGEEALRAFYRAETLDDVLKAIRAPKRLEAMVQQHYVTRRITPREIEFMRGLERVKHDHGTFIIGVVKLPEALDGRQVAVELHSEGPKVDWELAVNAQRMRWRGLPRSPLMMDAKSFRVEMTTSDYYNNSFDVGDWRAFRLTAPEATKPFYAYAPRRSDLGERLRQAISAETPEPAQLVVSLAVAERGDEVPQLRILELEHPHWLLPEEALPIHQAHDNRNLTLIDNF